MQLGKEYYFKMTGHRNLLKKYDDMHKKVYFEIKYIGRGKK